MCQEAALWDADLQKTQSQLTSRAANHQSISSRWYPLSTPPLVNSVPDVELWHWEDIPAQCQAPASLTTDRAEPRPAPDWHAENGPAGYWLQPPLALSWSLCLIATIKILHVVLLFASPLALRKAQGFNQWMTTDGTDLFWLGYFVTQITLLNWSVNDLPSSVPSECACTWSFTTTT